jgi:hypothetical protein
MDQRYEIIFNGSESLTNVIVERSLQVLFMLDRLACNSTLNLVKRVPPYKV